MTDTQTNAPIQAGAEPRTGSIGRAAAAGPTGSEPQQADEWAGYGRIVGEPIDEDAVRRAVEGDENGAVALFLGVVRNHDQGHGVLSLDYQAHPDAEHVLRILCRDVAAETGVQVAAAHRVGHLVVGDVALCAAASAAHRAEAFAACERLVERIKHEVPIWKRQHGADGSSEWVGL